ncbi:hypothetical protein MXB_4700, partial [Myxobolus squamalis]
MAKIAEQAERYDDMADFMKQLVELKSDELTLEIRNLLSVAYKNVVGLRRSSWRAISASFQKMDETSSKHHIVVEYKKRIETELIARCTELLELVEKCLKVENMAADSLYFITKLETTRKRLAKLPRKYPSLSIIIKSFDGAIAKLDCLAEESYKDSTLIMQLLRDNLTLWTDNQQEEFDKPKLPNIGVSTN